MHLVIYGPEGSGKGTQATLLSQKFHLPIYTSGDLVRDHALNDKGHLGDICRNALNKGIYVDDKTMFTLWQKKLSQSKAINGFILDGFPRNVNQAEFLLKMVERNGYSIDYFIFIKLSDEDSFERLTKRERKLFAGSKISHDTPLRIKKRLVIYRQYEADLLNFVKQRNLLIEVNGAQSVAKVLADIIQKLPGK